MLYLRWYIKSLYRHLFLVDISKHARVTHFLICGKDNSKALWATRPQIGLRVAKARSCDTDESKKNYGEPPPRVSVEKRRDHRKCVGGRQISVIPPLLSTITKVKKVFLLALALEMEDNVTLPPEKSSYFMRLYMCFTWKLYTV